MHQRDKQLARVSAFICGAFFVATVAFDYWPVSNPINWQSYDDAKAEARKLNKPLFVDLYADWCAPCRTMDRFVFPDDSVKEILNTRYVLARINIDDPVLGDTLRKEFRLSAVPTYVILTPGGRERKRHVGFYEKTEFLKWLRDSSHLVILSWQTFEKAEKAAHAQDKRLLVVVTGSNENLERLNSAFDSQNVGQLIDTTFVPTLLMRSSKEDKKIIDEIGGGKVWMNEAIVFHGEKEVGRFSITPDMGFNEGKLLEKLYELGGGRIPVSPEKFSLNRKVRRIS